MLFLNSRFLGLPVVSVQVAGRIGHVAEAIIDPETLGVVAYKVEGPLVNRREENILRTDDIREISTGNIFVDSIDELVSPETVISIGKIMELNFKLLKHKVVTEKGKKVGTVIDFSFDSLSFAVYQLIVQRPLVKSFNNPELTINRSQIVEIDDYKIVIKNDTEMVKIPLKNSGDLANFVNPFRGQTSHPELQNQSQNEEP
ncbi:MAG: PRC-barrel domain-containing protein [Candidatus Nomurabacteria bacterium]|jgi:uncharacterized protein YrrD|nr:PRC-barrel domain-containing protein [Candidatus Nomurabacteria bacterium]